MLGFGAFAVMIVVCFVLFAFLVSSLASDFYNDNALKYDEVKFRAEVDKRPHFIKFFAPWCGHCKRLAPTWDELAEKYNVDTDNQKVVIAKVDCTVDTALCTEEGISGYPTMKFFKPGARGVKYKGPRDIISLEAFLASNLGETEVEESPPKPPEPRHGLVELTNETFYKITEKGQHFIKFYAPWCGHCQKLAPVWDNLARSFEYDGSVKISKIDCTIHRLICHELEVKAFPTLLWIIDGKMREKYEGGRTHEELKEFINKKKEEQKFEDNDNKADSAVEHPAPVVHLTEDNFNNAIERGVTFVKFMAPWCGHCRRLAPTWDDLSRKFVTSTDVKIAKVDCTLQDGLCNKHKVQGYPTLLMFKNGLQVTEYSGVRDLSSLYNFIQEHLHHDEL